MNADVRMMKGSERMLRLSAPHYCIKPSHDVSEKAIMHARTVALLAVGLLAVACIAQATVPPITVNSTGDEAKNDNTCTLREAIISATTNAASGDSANGCIAGAPSPVVDVIAFAIQATDPGCSGSPKICTITLLSPLPDITEPVF